MKVTNLQAAITELRKRGYDTHDLLLIVAPEDFDESAFILSAAPPKDTADSNVDPLRGKSFRIELARADYIPSGFLLLPQR